MNLYYFIAFFHIALSIYYKQTFLQDMLYRETISHDVKTPHQAVPYSRKFNIVRVSSLVGMYFYST